MAWRELGSASGCMLLATAGHDVDLSYPQTAISAALQAMSVPVQHIAMDVSRTEFKDCVQHLQENGFRGMFLANPLKVEAARIAERFWVAKYPLGVANALLFEKGIFAQNTEVPAVTACVRNVEPSTALVMGTGHAARSVVAGLLDAGFKIRLWNRNANKARILQNLLGRYGEIDIVASADPTGCRLIVNATPLGAKLGEQAPVLWDRVLPKTVCLDLIFRRVPTDFLRAASNRGLKTVDGRELLVEQCALAVEWWTGSVAPREPMLAAVGLRKALAG